MMQLATTFAETLKVSLATGLVKLRTGKPEKEQPANANRWFKRPSDIADIKISELPKTPIYNAENSNASDSESSLVDTPPSCSIPNSPIARRPSLIMR